MEQAKFYKDMDIDVYHSHKDIISKSMLGDFADCPARFKHKYIDGNVQPKSKSLRLGNAVHTLALEPELWQAGYHRLPTTYFDNEGTKKAFKNDIRMQVVQDQYEQAGYTVTKNEQKQWVVTPGEKAKVILSQAEYVQVEAMANSLAKNNFACSILKAPGYVESSIFFDYEVENPETGEIEIVKMRTRPDLMRNDSLLADLKIARSVEPDLFHKDAFYYHYPLCVAVAYAGYEALHGKQPDNYVFVTVEQAEPHLVECYESLMPMDEMTGLTYLDYGRQHLNALMQRYVVCRANNTWPGYQTKIGSMKIPGWAIRKFIEEGF